MTQKSPQRKSKDQFVNLYNKALLAAVGHGHRTEYDAKDFSLKLFKGGEKVASVHFANLFTKYDLAHSSEKPLLLAGFVRAVTDTFDRFPKTKEAVLPNLRPKVMGLGSFMTMRLKARLLDYEADGGNVPFKVLANEIAVSLVYDTQDAMMMVNEKILSKWGLSFEEGQAAALDNLSQVPIRVVSQGKVFLFQTGDNYDASRILLTDHIKSLKVEGFPVALVPDRDKVIIGGSESPDWLEVGLDLAEKASDGTYPVSGSLFILKEDQWHPWQPLKSDKIFVRLKKLAIKYRGREYHEQQQFLEKEFEKKGDPVYFASYGAFQSQENPEDFFTNSVWTNGVDTLLPKTEKVSLLDMSESTDGKDFSYFVLPWERLGAITGLLEEVGCFPPLFRARKFPSKEQLSKIGITLQKADPENKTPFAMV